jgi:hypothetical protein
MNAANVLLPLQQAPSWSGARQLYVRRHEKNSV